MRKSLNRTIRNFVKSKGFAKQFHSFYVAWNSEINEPDSYPTVFAYATDDAVGFLCKKFDCNPRRLGLAFGDRPIAWVLFEIM